MIALPTASRTLWLFIRLRMRRLANTIGSRSKISKNKGRTGTASKASMNPVLIGVLAILMTFAFFSMHWAVITIVSDAYPQLFDDVQFVQAIAADVFVGIVVSVLMTLGGKEFARAEWDLEWLITLPISKGRLMWLRIGERTFANPISFFAMFPLFILLWYKAGLVWWLTPFAGYLTALPALLLVSVLQTLIDTGLRVHLLPSAVRNLQGVFNIVGVVAFYLSLGLHGAMPLSIAFVKDWIGPVLLFLPPGLMILVLRGEWWAAPLLIFETVLLVWMGYRGLLHLLRAGVISGSGQNSGRVKFPDTARVLTKPRETSEAKRALFSVSPMLVKEFRLLLRDRNYMVQTVFMPLAIIALQIYVQMGNGASGDVGMNRLAAIAFGMVSYALMFSVLNLLNSEGGSLWILYTFPRQIKDLVIEKTKPWLIISLVYWLAFAIYAFFVNGFSADYFIKMGLALGGVPIFVVLAMALGIFSFNPHVQEAERRQKPGILYLYMLMAGAYATGFFRENLWTTAVGVLLVGLVSYAFWQKASASLPYLMDPTEAPPAQVSLADGMIAAYAFFIFQAIFVGISVAVKGKDADMGASTLFGFAFAGIVTCGFARFHFYRIRAKGIPTYLSRDGLRDVVFGVLAGVACAVFANFYLEMAWTRSWFSDALSRSLSLQADDRMWLTILAVVFAPVFEEFIFRGLVYKGLTKTVRPSVAILGSALLFAAVHPPIAVVPVFVLGVLTAILYRRSDSLLPSTIAHAVYNFSVMIVPWLVAR